MDPRHALGKLAEDSAAQWFVHKRRARLVARNYRCRSGEIDLVFEENRPDTQLELVFVEVRARSRASWVDGIESVDWVKRRRLLRASHHFLARYQGKAESIRFDVVAWDGVAWKHAQNVWLDG